MEDFKNLKKESYIFLDIKKLMHSSKEIQEAFFEKASYYELSNIPQLIQSVYKNLKKKTEKEDFLKTFYYEDMTLV